MTPDGTKKVSGKAGYSACGGLPPGSIFPSAAVPSLRRGRPCDPARRVLLNRIIFPNKVKKELSLRAAHIQNTV